MKFEPTPIAGVFVATSDIRGDERGSFMRLYCGPSQEKAGIPPRAPVQINRSVTAQKGTVRGMHFQKYPSLEAKTVRCLKGRVLDVAVDLREDSPTFLKHVAVELDGKSGRALVIPEGCAHGFQTLEDDCEMLYLHSAAYDPANEGGVPYNDPALGIKWPLAVTVISDRDKSFAPIGVDFKGLGHAL